MGQVRLIPHGDDYALILDKGLLDAAGIDAETPLDAFTSDGKSLTIAPIKNESSHERLAESLKKINDRYPNALKHLAE